VYLDVPTNGEIRFTVVIEALTTDRADNIANLAVGLVPGNPPRPESGLLVIFQIESPFSPIQLKSTERGTIDNYLHQEYALGQSQSISIVLTAVSAAIYVDGDQLLQPQPIPDEAVFWIGYLLPQGSRIEARVEDLEVLSR
jgi:hypothetical protein